MKKNFRSSFSKLTVFLKPFRPRLNDPLRAVFSSAFVMLLILVGNAQANPKTAAYTEVTLMSAESELSIPGEQVLALRFRMEPGWHVYWKNPGDSGLPPEAKWIYPEGLSITAPQWPYPHSLNEEGLTTYGYDNEVTLLYSLNVPAGYKSESTVITADLSWLACETICVPGKAELSLTFPVENSQLILSPDKLKKIKHSIPLKAGSITVKVYESSEAYIIYYPTGKKLSGLEFYADQPETVEHAAEQQLVPIDGGYTLTVMKSHIAGGHPDKLSGVLINPDGWDSAGHKAVEINERIEPSGNFKVSVPSENKPLSLTLAALFAFLGGLILNLMPCVLPVLSIKVLNLVQQAGEDRKKILAHGMIFALGIIASFWVLAGLLIFLRVSGVQVGWGFQFQSPLFLILMAYLFFGFGLNLFGVFEIGVGLTRLGGKEQSKGTLKGSLFNGVLATIVATPCTAPFMGSALGFAVTQPTSVALIIFTCLGLGMAFPYLLLSVFPSWLRFVPKPGAWMVKLKQFFGFLMAATSIWLVWVLGVQRGLDAVTALLFGYVGFSLACWIFGGWAQGSARGPVKFTAWMLAVIITAVSVVWPVKTAYRQTAVSGGQKQAANGFYWEPYSLEIIESSLNKGHPVFVDFTASWCLTCQVNKKTSLNHPEVQQAFTDKNVVAVRADWSNYDERITRALQVFGKTSIPVYVLYTPGNRKNPVFLPEILTPQIVKSYLDKI